MALTLSDESMFDELMEKWTKSKSLEIQRLISKYPLKAFYTDKDGLSARRVLGVAEVESPDKYRAIVVTAHVGYINRVVGGVQFEELIKIEKWTDNHLAIINLCGCPEVFLKPYGFLIVGE